MLIPITSGWLSRIDKEERKARKRLNSVIKEIAKLEEKSKNCDFSTLVQVSQCAEELVQKLYAAEENYFKIIEHRDQLIEAAYGNCEELSKIEY